METVQVKKAPRFIRKPILQVKIVDQKYDKVWKLFVNNHPEATIYHLPQYLKALEEESNQTAVRLVCMDDKGLPRGILPLITTRGLPFNLGGILAGKRISSLPRTPVGGPLSSSIEASKLLLNRALELVQLSSNYILQIKYNSPELGLINQDIQSVPWRKCYIKTLPEKVDDLRFGKSSNHAAIKRAVNKAVKFGLKIREAENLEDLKKWYYLYLETMRHHVVPAQSLKFFNSLFESFKSGGNIKLLLAEYENGADSVLLAGTIFFLYNNTVTYAFNGSSRKDFSIRPNDLIIWTAMHNACEKGYKYFDMGEAAEGHNGLVQFKKKWTDKETQLYHYYYPMPPEIMAQDLCYESTTSLFKKIWQFTPLKITSQLGNKINKFL